MQALDVMSQETPENAQKIIERKLNPKWIKQRKGRGGITLDYLEGHRVIQLLNEAFDYKWSFQIVKKEMINPNKGNPFVEVMGQLTIPGVGIKQAYGSKTLVGDESQCAKAAATDALKKSASMVGIGLELWSDEPAGNNNYNNNPNNNYNNNQGNNNPPTDINQKRQQNSQPANNNNGGQPTWSQPEIVQAANKLKEHKKTLGIQKNGDLDPFVQEWSNGDLQNWRDITPANIQEFNKWLKEEKVNKLSA